MFKKRFGLITLLLCIVLTVGFFVINAGATSTVVMAIEGIIVDGNLVKFSGFNGLGVDTGLAATNVVKSNFAAGAAPTVNDDIDLGYTVGSRWLDLTNDKSYVCLDSTDGAAVWHLDVVGPGASTDHAIVRWDSTGGRTTLNSVVTVSDAGVIAGGEWQGTVVSPVYGGTGIANNVASTITITGSYAMTLTITGATGITLPESGTLCVTTGTPETTFQIDDDNTGPKFKNSAGEMQIRNAADDAYADLRALSFYGDGSNLTGVGAAAATALTISAKAAENIDKGEVVYISGATGPNAEVSLADNTDTVKHFFCGIAAETRTTGQTILIRVRGELTGFDTTAWAEGDVMYLSTAGTMTNVRPTSGAIEVIGYISYDHAAGNMIILHHSAHGIHVPSTDDIAIRMGDDVGANKAEFKNYSNTVLGTIDSYGRIAFGSFGTPLAVAANTYGVAWYYFGDNADVTAFRSRAILKTTDASTRTAQGAVIQASNVDGIDAGILQGALIEAIGKSDSTVSTITNMRGVLINTEWNAKETIVNLKTLYVRTHTRNSVTEGYISGTGYLLYLENEAVGGNGQQLDAGIFLKSTNVSTPYGFDYGIDLSGATGEIATADIRLSEGSMIDDSAALGITLVPIAGYVNVDQIRARSAAGLKLYDDGGNGLYIEDGGNVHFKNNVYAYGGSGGTYKQLKFVASADNQSTILRITPTGTPTLDDHGLTNIGGGLQIDGETDYSPRVFMGVEVGGDFVVSTYGDAGIRFMPNEATRMYIDKDGIIKMGDGVWTNYMQVSAAGVLTFEGTASINETMVVFAATTSAEFAGVISDETGTLKVVLSDSPIFTTQITTPKVIFGDGQGIYDANDNEQLIFQQIATAVNYLNLTNSATGNNIILEAIGSDDNVDFELKAKGTGEINVVSNLNVIPESQYPTAYSNTYVKATTEYSGREAYYAADPSTSLTGVATNNSWMSTLGTIASQRWHIDLGSTKIVTRIYYENFHFNGGDTTVGVENFTFWGSNTGAGSFDDLVYANDEGWTQLTTSQSTLDEHAAVDTADPKYITVTGSTAYRYYALKFADNWGSASYIGVRRIELQIAGEIKVERLMVGDNIVFEGETEDAFETTIVITEPTQDNNITFPDSSETVGVATSGALLLLSTTTIAFNADADTTLYTVPTGKRCVLSHAIIVAAGDAGATTTVSIGQNTAETDFVPANTLSNLDAQYDSVILQPIPNTTPLKIKSYAADTVIEAQVANQSGIVGNTIYLFGILY